MPTADKYMHYVTIERVNYPFYYSDSAVINPQDLLHPDDPTFYMLDLELTKELKMSHVITLEQIARFHGILKFTDGTHLTTEISEEGKSVILSYPSGVGMFRLPGSTELRLVQDAKRYSKPLFKILHEDMKQFDGINFEIIKELDIGEFLLTGEHPKVPYDRVLRRMDQVKCHSVAVSTPKPGVITHAVQGKYILATEYATPIFEANNNPAIGRDVSSKQALAKAEEVVWQQEGYLMAVLLDQL